MLNMFVSGVARPFPLDSDHLLSEKAVEYLKPFTPSLNAHSLPREPLTHASAVQRLIEDLWDPHLSIKSLKGIVQSVLTLLPSWVTDVSMVKISGECDP